MFILIATLLGFYADFSKCDVYDLLVDLNVCYNQECTYDFNKLSYSDILWNLLILSLRWLRSEFAKQYGGKYLGKIQRYKPTEVLYL